jgi:hypothetical protein
LVEVDRELPPVSLELRAVGYFNDHDSYGVSTFLHRRQTTLSFRRAPLAPAAVQALSPNLESVFVDQNDISPSEKSQNEETGSFHFISCRQSAAHVVTIKLEE